MLVVPATGHPAGALLGADELLPAWSKAWVSFAECEPPDEAARAWLEGARRAIGSHSLEPATKDFFLREAPERLAARDGWTIAQALLQKEILVEALPSWLREEQVSYGAELLRLASVSPGGWRERIAAWSAGPSLPWKLLAEAGAPPFTSAWSVTPRSSLPGCTSSTKPWGRWRAYGRPSQLGSVRTPSTKASTIRPPSLPRKRAASFARSSDGSGGSRRGRDNGVLTARRGRTQRCSRNPGSARPMPDETGDASCHASSFGAGRPRAVASLPPAGVAPTPTAG
jgi:hypothetical protein